MEREIKFRAWDTEAKAMSDSFSLLGEFTLLGAIHDWQMEIRGIDTVFENGDGPSLIEMLRDLKVMQYTGLKDKNGKEIYESDLVIWETVSLCPREVKFKDGAFYLKLGRLVNTFFSDNIRPEDELKVIGNVYQNPELFE